MADDFTQRMMDAESAANDAINGKDFHHSSGLNVDPASQTPGSGGELHEKLLRRAREAEALKASLGDQSTALRGYSDSLIASSAGDQETRRALTRAERADRMKREHRFSHPNPQSERSTITPSEKRRLKFQNRQDTPARVNLGPKERNTFREPPARGYNPYS